MLFHGNGYWLYVAFNSAKLLGSQSLRYKMEIFHGSCEIITDIPMKYLHYTKYIYTIYIYYCLVVDLPL